MAHKTIRFDGIQIRLVPDEYGQCPECTAYWGHPIPALDFPNRQKVDHLWKCYNPRCTVGYYDPDTRTVAERKPHEDDHEGLARQAERLAAVSYEFQKRADASIWIQPIGNDPDYGTYRMIPNDAPIPNGWELMPSHHNKENN